MMNAIMQWPLEVSMAIAVTISMLVPWLAVRQVRRIWPHPAFKENNELVGFTFAVYGLIYGVLLAFTIIVDWERFAGTERLVMQETTILSVVLTLDRVPSLTGVDVTLGHGWGQSSRA